MNTIKRIFGMLAIVSAVIFMDACKAEKGEVGPIGPTGAKGDPGATGATGAVGATGTANVIYSEWTNVTFAGSGTSYIANVAAPKLTQDILDKGDVHVYWKIGSSIYYIPYAQVLGTTTYTLFQILTVGNIKLTASYAISSSTSIRYVIIPGSIAGGRKAAVDYRNYEEVKKYYNLKD